MLLSSLVATQLAAGRSSIPRLAIAHEKSLCAILILLFATYPVTPRGTTALALSTFCSRSCSQFALPVAYLTKKRCSSS